MSGVLHGAVAASAWTFRFRYFILDVDDVRGTDFSGGKHFQLAEFTLRAGESNITGGTYRSWNGSFTGNSASNTGYPGSAGEEADKAADGNTTTKYNDSRTVGTNGAGIWIDLGAGQIVTSYTWKTGNDETGRDMTAWKLYGSNDNTTWTLLSTVTGFTPTTSRQASAGSWSL